MLIFAVPALLMFVASTGAEPIALPDGWRYPLAGEMDAAWRAADPDRHLRAAGDFNGDGNSDSAVVLISRDHGPAGWPRAIAVYAMLSQRGGGHELRLVLVQEHPLPADFQQFGIAARPPGHYVTACAAGYADPCGPGESKSVDLPFDGIECGLFESVTGIYWWNPATGRFDGAPFSD